MAETNAALAAAEDGGDLGGSAKHAKYPSTETLIALLLGFSSCTLRTLLPGGSAETGAPTASPAVSRFFRLHSVVGSDSHLQAERQPAVRREGRSPAEWHLNMIKRLHIGGANVTDEVELRGATKNALGSDGFSQSAIIALYDHTIPAGAPPKRGALHSPRGRGTSRSGGRVEAVGGRTRVGGGWKVCVGATSAPWRRRLGLCHRQVSVPPLGTAAAGGVSAITGLNHHFEQ